MPKPPLTLLLPLLLLTTPALAQDPAPPPLWPVQQFHALLATLEPTPESRANTARLIRDLTADNYPTREAASKELATKGPAAFPGLREAVAASTDPELLSRTAECFKSGKIFVPPNVPEVTVALVRLYEKSRAEYVDSRQGDTSRLLYFLSSRTGEFVNLFFEIVLPQEPDKVAHAVLQREFDNRSKTSARMAIAEGKLDQAELILRASKDHETAADIAALISLRQGISLDPERETERLGLKESAKDHMAMLLYRAKGDYVRAAEFAKSDQDSTAFPWREVIIEAGDYVKLAKSIEALPNRQSFDIDHVLAFKLAGDSGHANDILNTIIKNAENTNLISNVPELLIVSDRSDDAIAASQRIALRRNWAFHLLCARLQIREAIATIQDRTNASFDLTRQLIEMGLPSAATILLRDMRPLEPANDKYQYHSYFHYADQLALAGQLKEAQEWREAGFQRLDPVATEFAALAAQSLKLHAERERATENFDDESRLRDALLISQIDAKMSDYVVKPPPLAV